MAEAAVSDGGSPPIAVTSSGKITGRKHRPALQEITAEIAIGTPAIVGHARAEGAGGRRSAGLRGARAAKRAVAALLPAVTRAVLRLSAGGSEMPSRPIAIIRASTPKRAICLVSTVLR